MAATKTVIGAGAQYHVSDFNNNHIAVAQGPQRDGAVRTLTISAGGLVVELTQQNVSDLLAALTAFANNGLVT
jgi:hypothetical protein